MSLGRINARCGKSPGVVPAPIPGACRDTGATPVPRGKLPMAATTKTERKRLDAPDETRTFPKGRNEVVTVGGTTLGRITLEPGWHWAEHVKPIAGTDLCMVPHLQYVVSGRMRLRTQSGDEYDAGAGDALWIPPGHDAWVLGSENVVAIEVMGAAEYAKPK